MAEWLRLGSRQAGGRGGAGRPWLPWAAAALLFAALGLWAVDAIALGDHPWPLTSAADPGRQPHFVLISQQHDNPYWQQVRRGAEEAAARLGVRLEYVGPVRADLKAHRKLLDMAIAARVDGILTQGLTEAEFVPLIDKAVERGIPVVTIDTDALRSRRLAYIGTDNYDSGVRAGHWFVRATGGQAVVGIVTGTLEAINQQQRVEGFLSVVAGFPGIRVAGKEVSNIDKVQAVAAADKLLREHPDLTAIFATSALDGPGAAQAVKNRGLTGRVLIVGYDDVPETIEFLRAGLIHATVVQKPVLMGRRGVERLVDHRAGRAFPPVEDTGVTILTPADLSAPGGGPGAAAGPAAPEPGGARR